MFGEIQPWTNVPADVLDAGDWLEWEVDAQAKRPKFPESMDECMFVKGFIFACWNPEPYRRILSREQVSKSRVYFEIFKFL